MPNLAVVSPQPGDEVTAPWGQSVAAALNGIQSGVANCTFAGSTASAVTTVTFPRPFASAPVVVASLDGTGGNAWGLAFNATATSVQIQARSTASVASGTFPVAWIAIGVPA
jgi:hypothetical protein